MAFFLGCDVSKGYADFVILNGRKEVMENDFQLDDNFEGHEKLYEVLNAFRKKHPFGVIYVGLESTGDMRTTGFTS